MNELNFDDFWERLKNLSKENDVTQISLCKTLGFDIQTFRNRKTTKSFPPIQDLVKLAMFFEVSLDYLITGKPSSDAEKNLFQQVESYKDKLARIQDIVNASLSSLNG